MPRSPREPVGCAQCWPESAEAAWKFRQQLVCDRTLVDESHFSLAVQKLALARWRNHGAVPFRTIQSSRWI